MERAIALTRLLDSLIREKAANFPDEKFTLAISGGGSPQGLFALWSGIYKEIIPWEMVSLFWVDERAVAPSDPESNYGNAKSLFLDKISIPRESVYRIVADIDTTLAAREYSNLVKSKMAVKDGYPVFDLIILGVGDDGHTASIFPGQIDLLFSPDAYAPSVNPYTGQQRVTMTGGTISNAKNVVFYLKGESKKTILEKLEAGYKTADLPAAFFLKKFGENSIYFDMK